MRNTRADWLFLCSWLSFLGAHAQWWRALCPSCARNQGRGRLKVKAGLALMGGLLMPLGVLAQLVIQDNLNGASSSYPWQSFGSACLTAGNNTGSIPSCTARDRIKVADPVGEGALRLTDNRKWDAGWLVSKFALPSNEGLEVTWTSVAYDGDDFSGHGADGLSFFLIDASSVTRIDATLPLGAGGGSLGYASQHHPNWHVSGAAPRMMKET